MFETTRRKMLGASVLSAGAALIGFDAKASGTTPQSTGNVTMDNIPNLPKGLTQAAQFPLIDAIHGRRSRRFARGASIPDGPLAYTSKHDPAPLSELEQMLLLTTVAGNTGWSNLIPYNRHYAPNIPNYAGAAGGRTFPSAAGFHTTEVFYTDDNGVYFMPTKDMPAVEADNGGGKTDMQAYFAAHKSRIVKIANGRLHIPVSPQHMEMHNDWCANVAGSTLIIPVSDLAQHMILNLCYLVQNGACIYDDVNKRSIPGIEAFKQIVDVENYYPLSYLEQIAMNEVAVESSTSCYAGALMLQAMGLGGWMYEGINPFSILGASGDPKVPGLGFRYEMLPENPLPNVTGLDGVFEGHCPPHFADMRSAVESVIARKYGAGGPFNEETKGPYKDTAAVRGSGARMNAAFVDCVTHMADYTLKTFGKFPGTVPAIFTMMYLQAHRLDTAFYDTHFDAGGYLQTHADHDMNWSV